VLYGDGVNNQKSKNFLLHVANAFPLRKREDTVVPANIIVNSLWDIRSQKGNLRALHRLLTEIWGAYDNYTVPIGMTSNLDFETIFYLNDPEHEWPLGHGLASSWG
jgi:hypothetical protein